jgi:spermidine synthase
MDYIVVHCSEGKDITIKVKKELFKGFSPSQEIAVYDTEEFGRCLFLDNIIQSSEADHAIYDEAMLKKLSPSDKNLLILGGGDGYIAQRALMINPEINITIVDLDEVVVEVSRRYLSQDLFNDHRVRVVIRDALEFMLEEEEGSYDGIISDLTDFPVGYDNRMRELFSGIFDRAGRLLREGGWISLYGGVKGLMAENHERVVDLLQKLLERYFHNTESSEVFIPSFGEPCYILYGEDSRWHYS